MRLDRPVQHLVMGGQRRTHAIGVGLPPTGRTLDIGEQKRHHPRRSSRRISGHPRRLSQATRSTWHLAGIRPRHPRPEARRSALPAGRDRRRLTLGDVERHLVQLAAHPPDCGSGRCRPQYPQPYFATFWLDPWGLMFEAVCHYDRD